MPVYVYRCEECGSEVEKRQSFSDQPLTVCESCHGRLHKVLQPTAIVFKGSGFYCTDHRSSSVLPANGTNGTNGTSNSTDAAKGSGESSKGTGEASATPSGAGDKTASGKSAAATAKE